MAQILNLSIYVFVFCITADISECQKVRQQIPISKQRRTDIYDTVLKQLQTEKVKNQVNENVEKKADAKTEDEFAKKKSATCAAMKVE